jgi:hypothetical protein
MRGKTYDNYLVVRSILAERERAVQVMAVQDQKAILSHNSLVSCCRIKIIPKPRSAQLLVGPTIWRDGYAVQIGKIDLYYYVNINDANLALQGLLRPHSEFRL